jgi:predicted AAA+ superfamily ATPase
MRKRFFNVAGPCIPGKHYMLDPFRGISGELMDLIDREHYFVIHAARQSGKTTLLLELVESISMRGDYYALYCSLEAVEMFDEPGKRR